jgi:hypothetical protein
MRYLGVPPDELHHSDCSEHATEAYFWAKKKTGLNVPDPNGSGYNGSGYTGTLYNNPVVSDGKFKVGDLAIYGAAGDTEHVCTCYASGSASSAVWCSNGSEGAPYAVALHYRSDLMRVVRPTLVLNAEVEPVEAWVIDWLPWYVFGRNEDPPKKRPAGVPEKIPEEVWDLEREVLAMLKRQGAHAKYQEWRDWYDTPNRDPADKPDGVPDKIYDPWWWDARKRDHAS